MFAISWVNAIAAPYVIFLFIINGVWLKQWCVLCLTVVGILILQPTIALLGGWRSFLTLGAIEPSLAMTVIAAFTIPFIATALLMPALQTAKESKRLNNELQKLKYSGQIFEALLQEQKLVTKNPNGLGISVGNPNAAFKLH